MLLPALLICFVLTAQTPFPSSQTDGQYYTINGAKLWVVTVGSGEPLIIIPGGPGGNHYGYRAFDSLSVKGNIQLIYFDAFGPRVQPEMWTEELFSKIYFCVMTQGRKKFIEKGNDSMLFRH